MKLLDVGRRESLETPEQTLARLNAQVHAAPAPKASSRPSQGLGERLAHISQRRWRALCVAGWVGLAVLFFAVFGLVDTYWPDSTPDDAGAAAFFALFAGFVCFWGAGAARTIHIDPGKRTAVQRIIRYIWEHPPRGG